MGDDREPNTNQTAGRIGQSVGEVKEEAGKKAGDDDLKREGELDQVSGRAQENLGDRQVDAGLEARSKSRRRRHF